MCIRPPCENCGANYDACCTVCPKCGHPNGKGAFMPHFDAFSAQVKEIKEKHYCKICKCDHEVTRFEFK